LIEPSVITLCSLCLNPNYDLDIVSIQSRVKETHVLAWLIGHDLAMFLVGKFLKEVCTC
jgi:hypothetical protein